MVTRPLCPSGSFTALVFGGNPLTKAKTTKLYFLKWAHLRMDTIKMYFKATQFVLGTVL